MGKRDGAGGNSRTPGPSPRVGLGQRTVLSQTTKLTRPEQVVLLVLVVGGALIDFITFLGSTGADPLHTAISIATSLTFALYLWSPGIAVAALAAAVASSFVTGNGLAGLLAAAISAAPVLRLARTPVVVSYVGGLLFANVLFSYGVGGSHPSPGNIALLLLVAGLASGIGMALRITHARGNRLEHELSESAEREREAILAERRWLAGELHDSIAHYLTIIALHVQLLDDAQLRPDSQEAIRIAARKALSDLRFVIGLAEDSPQSTEIHSADLSDAITEAVAEIEAAGHVVQATGDPSDQTIPHGAKLILARVLRESATNILKYAGEGEVTIDLSVEPEWVGLRICSPLTTTPRRDLPSTGTGLNRMAERVLGVRGEFSSEAGSDGWVTSVRLPVA